MIYGFNFSTKVTKAMCILQHIHGFNICGGCVGNNDDDGMQTCKRDVIMT